MDMPKSLFLRLLSASLSKLSNTFPLSRRPRPIAVV
jgi:hypothetical protein